MSENGYFSKQESSGGDNGWIKQITYGYLGSETWFDIGLLTMVTLTMVLHDIQTQVS